MEGTNRELGSGRESLDPELASFCRRFDLDPRVPDFENDQDGNESSNDARGLGSEGLDADHNGPEITEQSELEHFSAVLQCAQQVAIQLEKEKLESRKRKTPRQYMGNSLQTKYRHKKARLQLAEKGFLGVFQYLELQKHRAARASSGAPSNLEKGPSAKEQPVPEEEEEESSSEDGGVEENLAAPASSITAASANATLPNATAGMTAAASVAVVNTAATTNTSAPTVAPSNFQHAIGARACTPQPTIGTRACTPQPAISTRAHTPQPAIGTRACTLQPTIAAVDGMAFGLALDTLSAVDVQLMVADMAFGIKDVEAGVEGHPNGLQDPSEVVS